MLPHLARPVDPVVHRVLGRDHAGQLGVVNAALRRRAPWPRSRCSGRPAAGCRSARPRTGPCDRRRAPRSPCGRSSSAAKKADALRKIALDRRSSLTSRSSSANRAASDAVVPARSPASTSAWLTHPRNVSGLIPSCSPTRCNAPGRLTGSRRASTAIRIARPRSSSGYFLGATMTLILSGIESLHQTRHEQFGRRPEDVVATHCLTGATPSDNASEGPRCAAVSPPRSGAGSPLNR